MDPHLHNLLKLAPQNFSQLGFFNFFKPNHPWSNKFWFTWFYLGFFATKQKIPVHQPKNWGFPTFDDNCQSE